MDRRNEQVVLLGALLAVVWLVLDALVGSRAHLLVGAAVLPYLAVAAAIGLVVWARLRLTRRAEEEQRDQEIGKKEQTDTALFGADTEGFDPFTAGRSAAQFEKWVVPVVALLVAAGEAAWAWRLWRDMGRPHDPPTHQLLAASLLAAQAFALFLLSRYLLGLGKIAGGGRQLLLRGPGAMLGLACLASLVGAVVAVVQKVGYPPADGWAARGLVVGLGLLAAEQAFNFVWELYRPRRRRDLARAYETRLGLLVTDPASWLRNVGGALDYQFGFQVSETWLYRFLERALVPLVLFQLAVLYLLSALVFLGPDEQGIVERFGRPRSAGWQLESGLHLKWPWPFETVRRFPVQRVQWFPIGYSGGSPRQSGPVNANVVLWTVPHYAQEDQFLTASRDVTALLAGPELLVGGGLAGGPAATTAVPVNLVTFTGRVEYRITDVRRYAYSAAEPRRLLEQIAYRSLTLEAAARDLFAVMTTGRQELAEALRARIQQEADRRGLGVAILFVGIEGVHPPVSIADAFQSVIGATEEKEATVVQARAMAVRTVALTGADAAKVAADAVAYAWRRTQIAAADADRFQVRLATYQKSPQVFPLRAYLGSLQEALRGARKYIVAVAPTTEVLIFNYEEKLQTDLLDFGPAPRPAGPGGAAAAGGGK